MNFCPLQLVIVKLENILFISFLRCIITQLNISLIMHSNQCILLFQTEVSAIICGVCVHECVFGHEMCVTPGTWNCIIEVNTVMRNLFLSRARLKLSPSYCSKGTVWLLVSHLWTLCVFVCVALSPRDSLPLSHWLQSCFEVLPQRRGEGEGDWDKEGFGGGSTVKMLHFYPCAHSAHH